jgi:hypothetical protein
MYKALGKKYTPVQNEINSYEQIMDTDNNGVVDKSDLENLLFKSLIVNKNTIEI